MGEKDESERSFTVVDRRGSAGETDDSVAEAVAPEAPSEEPAAAEPSASEDLPALDFATFVLSLGTSALFHLGMIEDPATGSPNPEPDVLLARQTVDTIAMLQEKTLGNLSDDEAHLVESLLYELRMRVVEADS